MGLTTVLLGFVIPGEAFSLILVSVETFSHPPQRLCHFNFCSAGLCEAITGMEMSSDQTEE